MAQNGEKMRLSDKLIIWCSRHGTTVLYLATVFFLGLILRIYFATELITQNGPLYLYSGGSDSYYHSRVIEYIVANKHHLVLDTMLNYPSGAINPRAPLFDWMVAILGVMLAPFFGGDAVLSAAYVLVYIAPVWGSLCIFPLYFLTKDIFGRKTALLAVFFLTFMEAQVERSIATFGNYLPFYLFMVLTTLFFYVRTIKMVGTNRWVASWRHFTDIKKGLKMFFVHERKALLYSAMTGVSIGATAMAWQGFTYMEAILLIYLFVQIFINHIRKVDSTGIYLVTMISMGIGFALAFPYYYGDQLIPIWFDVPVYLYIGAAVFGYILISTRDVPWVIVFPAIGITLGLAALAIYLINPGYFQIIISGQGYFVKTKVYSTVAEAQAPDFSRVVLAFGAATTFLGMLGFAYLIYRTYKTWTAPYLFFATFSAMSVYLAATAGKFTFLGSPMFSVLSAWFVLLLINIADFAEMRKTFAGTIGGGLWYAIKKSVKVTHVVMVLFLAFIVVFPNVWFAIDASIPYETKRKFDKQIYEAMPDFAKPSDYDKINGSYRYFGAFGFSVPLPNTYWPDAYKWLSRQDADEFPDDRPAFVSWWDYGFEAVDVGHHPTVADNFQNGIPIAGNFLMSQNESQAISLLIAHLMYVWYYKDNAKYEQILKLLEESGIPTQPIRERFADPKGTIGIVLDNPRIYGPRDPTLNEQNAYYTWASVYILSKLDLRSLAELYNRVMEVTGNRIYYFAVDARLFPFSGTNTGIFYAPAKLSDQRMKGRGESIPYDYYNLKAISEYGGEYDLADVPAGVRIVDYKIEYTDMFYNTMLYRIYVGYSGKDIGQSEGIPALTSGFENYQRMPGWNMTHFRVVYLTAYWNPYKDYQNHSDAWRAINYAEAIEKQKHDEGVVDLSSRSSIGQSVAMIKYYPGAFFNGTLKLSSGAPASGYRITVQDEFGIPHMSVVTGTDGKYNLILPFGNISIVVSTGGDLNKMSMTEKTEITRYTLNVSEAAAYRENVDADKDGNWDYLLKKDIVIPTGTIKGTVFWDNDNSATYSSTSDTVIPNARVYLTRNSTNETYNATTDASGTYLCSNLPPGVYNVSAVVGLFSTISQTADAKPNENTTLDIAVQPGKIDGNVTVKGMPAGNITVLLSDQENNTQSQITNETGEFAFDRLAPGNYTLYVSAGNYVSEKIDISLSQGSRETKEVEAFPAAKIRGHLSVGNLPAAYASVRIINLDNRKLSDVATADALGNFEVTLPEGYMYSIYAMSIKGDVRYTNFTSLILENDTAITLKLQHSVKITGKVVSGTTNETMYGYTMVISRGNETTWFFTNYSGNYEIYVPQGTYEMKNLPWITGVNWTYVERKEIVGDTVWDVTLADGDAYNGRVYADINENGAYDPGEAISNARVYFNDENGLHIYTKTGDDGMFRANLPKGKQYTIRVCAPDYIPKDYPFMNFENMPGEIPLMPVNVSVNCKIEFLNFKNENLSIVVHGGPGNRDYFINASHDTNITMQVHPGNYTVSVINQNDSDVRYALAEDTAFSTLEVSEIEIKVLKEVNITGTTTLNGNKMNAVVKFINATNGNTIDTTTDQLEDGIFVPIGRWNVVCIAERGEEHFAAIEHINVQEYQKYNFSLRYGYRINLQILYEGTGVSYIPVMCTINNISFQMNTDIGGNVEFTLPANTSAKFTVNHTTTESIAGLNRTVHYEGANETFVNASKTVTFTVTKEIMNRIVSGQVNLAGKSGLEGYVEFQAETTGESIRTQITNSTFSVRLHADTYNVYAYVKDYAIDYAATTKILVKEDVDMHLNLDLVPCYNLGLHVSSNISGNRTITITGQEWKYQTTITSNYLSIFLPGGQYRVRISQFTYDNGLRVELADEQHIQIYNTTTTVYLKPEKVIVRAIQVIWNEAEHTVMAKNETRVFSIIVKNIGNSEEKIGLTGAPADWKFNFSETGFTLGYGTTNNTKRIDVYVTTPEDAKVNHPPVIITAMSYFNTSVTASEQLGIEIKEERNCTLGTASNYKLENGTVSYDIVLKNTGNIADTFKVLIVNAKEIEEMGWIPKIYIGDREVTNTSEVEPDATATLTVKLVPADNAIKITERIKVKVYAISETNKGASATGEYSIPVSKLSIMGEDFSVDGERIVMKPESVDYAPYIWGTAIAIVVLLGIAVYFRWGVVK